MRTFIAALLVLPAVAFAADTLPGPIQAEVIRVIDGDTIEVRAEIWLGQYIETNVRLAGMDAPGHGVGDRAAARRGRRSAAPLGWQTRRGQIRRLGTQDPCHPVPPVFTAVPVGGSPQQSLPLVQA
mgnify:CR=1 FL=1|jgi:hypothetical protein